MNKGEVILMLHRFLEDPEIAQLVAVWEKTDKPLPEILLLGGALMVGEQKLQAITALSIAHGIHGSEASKSLTQLVVSLDHIKKQGRLAESYALSVNEALTKISERLYFETTEQGDK